MGMCFFLNVGHRNTSTNISAALILSQSSSKTASTLLLGRDAPAPNTYQTNMFFIHHHDVMYPENRGSLWKMSFCLVFNLAIFMHLHPCNTCLRISWDTPNKRFGSVLSQGLYRDLQFTLDFGDRMILRVP